MRRLKLKILVVFFIWKIAQRITLILLVLYRVIAYGGQENMQMKIGTTKKVSLLILGELQIISKNIGLIELEYAQDQEIQKLEIQ